MSLSDAQAAEFERICNAAIYELVFAVQHMEHGDVEDVANCLSQVHLNADSALEIITPEA